VILVCAATGTEAAACRAGIADAGAAGYEVLTTGVGPERAAAALRRRLASAGTSPSLVVSSGFAGALTEGVDPLAWVTASALYQRTGDGALAAVDGVGLRVVPDALACAFVTSRAVESGGSGAALRGACLPPPCCVDMESAALARVCSSRAVAFAVLRLVTDAPAKPLAAVASPLAAALAADGIAARVRHALRAAGTAVREPRAAAGFLRDTAVWRERLRGGWRDRAPAFALLVM
jgi:nucleoside phosphorylase